MSAIQKVLFIGSKNLGLRCLQTIHELAPDALAGVLTFDDRSDVRNAYADIKNYCLTHLIPLRIAQNRAESEQYIQKFQPDLCLVAGWYWLIGNETLKQVPNGFIGIHNSLLPQYRGSSPLVWSIINEEPQVGFSFFTFTDAMDEGDIWIQHSMDLRPEDNIGSVLARIEDAVCEELKQKYVSILYGSLKPKHQKHSDATYCAQRLPADGLINWHMPARVVYNFIRAQSQPYPGAFTFFKDVKLTIWQTTLVPHVYYGTPGQVAQITNDGVIVVCGDNQALCLQAVQYEDQDLPANEVIKSIKTRFTNSAGSFQENMSATAPLPNAHHSPTP